MRPASAATRDQMTVNVSLTVTFHVIDVRTASYW